MSEQKYFMLPPEFKMAILPCHEISEASIIFDWPRINQQESFPDNEEQCA